MDTNDFMFSIAVTAGITLVFVLVAVTKSLWREDTPPRPKTKKTTAPRQSRKRKHVRHIVPEPTEKPHLDMRLLLRVSTIIDHIAKNLASPQASVSTAIRGLRSVVVIATGHQDAAWMTILRHARHMMNTLSEAPIIADEVEHALFQLQSAITTIISRVDGGDGVEKALGE